MAKLSSAAWLVHDVGLAASIGGTLFGRMALQPALYKITRPEERDLVSAAAWQRFSWINVIGHAAFAVPWLVGRTKLGDVSPRARSIARMKDVFVTASLITGVSSTVLSRWLATRANEGRGPQAVTQSQRFAHDDPEVARTRTIHRAVGMLGMMNMVATIGVDVLTRLLAMESSKSTGRSAVSRFLAKAEAARLDCLGRR